MFITAFGPTSQPRYSLVKHWNKQYFNSACVLKPAACIKSSAEEKKTKKLKALKCKYVFCPVWMTVNKTQWPNPIYQNNLQLFKNKNNLQTSCSQGCSKCSNVTNWLGDEDLIKNHWNPATSKPVKLGKDWNWNVTKIKMSNKLKCH